MYKIGRTYKVRKVAKIKPPITTVAKGLCTSAPSPVLKAIGKNPNEATKAVIKTGLNLVFPPFITISINGVSSLACLSWLNSAMSTIPFRTATPNNAIKPIPAEILKGRPLILKAKIPPIAEKGIAV